MWKEARSGGLYARERPNGPVKGPPGAPIFGAPL